LILAAVLNAISLTLATTLNFNWLLLLLWRKINWPWLTRWKSINKPLEAEIVELPATVNTDPDVQLVAYKIVFGKKSKNILEAAHMVFYRTFSTQNWTLTQYRHNLTFFLLLPNCFEHWTLNQQTRFNVVLVITQLFSNIEH